MAEEFRVLRPKEYHSELINKGTRADGRKLHERRDMKLEINAIQTADSSSLVKLGNTSLVCGCISKESEQDELNITIEFPPICSSPTTNRTHVAEQLLTRSLKDIFEDFQCLEKEESEVHTSIDVQVICLNYDGSFLDAAVLAVMGALKCLNFKITAKLICTTFAIINNTIIMDPNSDEEQVADSTLSVIVDMENQSKYSIKKQGGSAISDKQLLRCLELSKKIL